MSEFKFVLIHILITFNMGYAIWEIISTISTLKRWRREKREIEIKRKRKEVEK